MTLAAFVLAASPAIRAIRAEGVEFRIYDDEGNVALSVSAPKAECLGTSYVVPGDVTFLARVSGWSFEGSGRDGRFDEEGAGELREEFAVGYRSREKRGSARLPGAVYEGRVRGEGTIVARLSAPGWGEEAVLTARSYSFSPEGDTAVFREEVVILLPPGAAKELGFPLAAAATIECEEAAFRFSGGLERAVFSGGVRVSTRGTEVTCGRVELRESAGEFDVRALGGVRLSSGGLSARAARAEVSGGLVTAWEGEASWKGWRLPFAEMVYDAESGAFTAREGGLLR